MKFVPIKRPPVTLIYWQPDGDNSTTAESDIVVAKCVGGQKSPLPGAVVFLRILAGVAEVFVLSPQPCMIARLDGPETPGFVAWSIKGRCGCRGRVEDVGDRWFRIRLDAA